MKTALKYILVVIPCFCGRTFGHDVPVHQAITVNAEASAFAHSSTYADFINTISSDFPRQASLPNSSVTNSMVNGSAREDDPVGHFPTDVGGYRSLNHFYDPVYSNYGRGLSDSPFLLIASGDSRSLLGTNSFAWASISNCVGISTFLYSHPVNTWSWQNARYYEWLGLTASNQITRQANLDNMFRAVGQVMHLLEDASQPQHVRNEQHVDTFGTLFWESPIEDYGVQKDNLGIPNYQKNPQWFVMPPNAIIGWPSWQAAGFTKLEDFWDRHLYNGSAAALDNAETPGGTQLGLAEWCNGNFIGDRHTYAEFFSPSSIKYYPNPSLKNTTQPNLNPYNLSGSVIDTTTLENGKQGQRVYISQTGDGVNIVHQSALDYLAVKHPPRLNTPGMQVTLTIRDANVLQEYHNLFIPKAVEYSAGLLDYFFRGIMTAGIIGSDASLVQFTNIFINTSGQDFSNGTFYIYQDDASNNRTLFVQTNLVGTLANGDSLITVFPGLAPTNKLTILYQGTVLVPGSTADPVDANIGIAIARPVVEQTVSYPDAYPIDLSYATISTNLDSPDFGFVPGRFEVTINSAVFDDEGTIGGVDSIGDVYPSTISNVNIDPSQVSVVGNRLRVSLTATDLHGSPMGYQTVSITWRAWLPGQ